jgi:hypothetical protein
LRRARPYLLRGTRHGGTIEVVRREVAKRIAWRIRAVYHEARGEEARGHARCDEDIEPITPRRDEVVKP